ncbi:uncharacterized protein FIBRA_06683 [Fibroporia radiculosa]|uniref:Protein YOP1 n=1 Tax=Fibroporia radiculosa TaxID=599839 RepID=J4GC77_9APHY|nr:uncharacterized protein FIBRA_06683 [Fibroporia radiculosa]CCM04503.1 predicted protein [Fibroporia radiculosa]
MFFYFTFKIISATVAFLYPGYASYKTLSQRPASEEELERWLMYWSVLGCIVAVEYVAEWLVSWLPFYYPIKMIFLLYLALPQTAGAAYVYRAHLQPFFATHESQIDSALAQLKAHLYSSLQRVLRAAWDHVSATLRQMNMPVGNEAPLTQEAAVNSGAPPTLSDPVSGPTQLVQGLWGSYGPSIIASGAALLRQAQASTAQAANAATANVGGRRASSSSAQPPVQPYDLSDSNPSSPAAAQSVLMPSADHPRRDSSSSSGSMRRRVDSGNAKSTFEEVEVPSDMEGEGVGHAVPERPAQTRKTSWFGWGSANAGKGYERVKDD